MDSCKFPWLTKASFKNGEVLELTITFNKVMILLETLMKNMKIPPKTINKQITPIAWNNIAAECKITMWISNSNKEKQIRCHKVRYLYLVHTSANYFTNYVHSSKKYWLIWQSFRTLLAKITNTTQILKKNPQVFLLYLTKIPVRCNININTLAKYNKWTKIFLLDLFI